VRHETLGNLSHLPDPLIDLIRRSLAGEQFVVAADAFQVECSLPHGHVQAVEEDLYRAMRWLLARQPRIESKLAQRRLHHGAIVWYDVSSSSYEGRPVAIEVYPGHTGDPTTVPDQVEKLRPRFGLSRVVLVGDRGMLTEAEIAQLREHPGLGWISALRGPAIRQLVESGSLPLSLFEETNLAEIRSAEYPGERLVACFHPLLAEERRRKREERLAATEKELARIARRDPVAPPKPSAPAQRKKIRRMTPDGFPVHSFDTLLEILGARCRNLCRIRQQAGDATFHQLTTPAALQARAFEMLGV